MENNILNFWNKLSVKSQDHDRLKIKELIASLTG